MTYEFVPEPSKAANFDDFARDTFVKGLVATEADFCGTAGGVAETDSIMGLLGTSGGVKGDTTGGVGAVVAPMFRFRCISKSPTCRGVTRYHFEIVVCTHMRLYICLNIKACNSKNA